MIATNYSVDMLYYSPFPWVSCEYLSEKMAAGGFWQNIFGDTCETRIVSASSITLEEYRQSWLRLTGDAYKKEEKRREVYGYDYLPAIDKPVWGL